MKKIIISILLVAMLATALLCFSVGAKSDDPADGYTHVDAEYEDSGIELWFDYASEKVSPDETESTGMETFSVYMAKNEIENAQFVLLADSDRSGLTASLSGFENEAGDKLSAEVFIQLYHDCGKFGMVPDAIPPLSAYGAFELTGGSTQTFLIKVTTKEDTAPGWYSSDLTIADADGKEIKYTKVFVYVWDFALSEETACATSIDLDYQYLERTPYHNGYDGAELYKNYYDYLLENRVCAMNLPYKVTTAEGRAYLDNPRVTSFQIQSDMLGGETTYYKSSRVWNSVFSGEENAHRFEKAYYFAADLDRYKQALDPLTPEQLEVLKNAYDTEMPGYKAVQPSYSDIPMNFICTYFSDIDYTLEDGTVIDQIDYYDDFVSILCSKPFAYTSPEELSVPGAKVMQPEKWDAVYGTFKERMEEYKADGNQVWWFLSWDVEAPYINYYMQTDGVSQRILFWQQYDNGVEGFLTNFVNFWMGDCADPYNYNVTNSTYPDSHGESILIYPGGRYGLSTPVGSLRLEAMRDGIEDYQMFTMLDAKRDGASAAIIDEMTTGMVTYSTSDSHYYETRKALGNAVELAESGICAHDYEISEELSVFASCTEDGNLVYVCSLCGDSYSEAVSATGHSYENGSCTVCGEAEPLPEYVLGDANGDGEVKTADSLMAKRIAAGIDTPTELQEKALDVNGDDKINSADTNLISRFIAGIIIEF